MGMSSEYQCEIVVPLFGDLASIKETLSSLVNCRSTTQHKVTLLAVAGDRATVEYLSSVTDDVIDLKIIEGSAIASINDILRASSSKYTCFISGNAIFSEHWLEKLVSAIELNAGTFAAIPLSNGGGSTAVPIPPGCSINTMSWFFNARTRRVSPDLYLDLPACVLFNNSIFEEFGFLDTNYCNLKWALLDFTVFSAEFAPRISLAETSFVFQFSDKSLTEFEQDREYFYSKPLAEKKLQTLQRHNKKQMSSILTEVAPGSRWTPLTTARETYRKIRNHYHRGELRSMIKAAVKGVLQLPRGSTAVVGKRFTSKMVQPEKLRVTYVLHNLTVAGGVISTIQIANELVLLGAEVRVVALYQYPETERWKWYTQPIIYRDANELIRNFPESDVAIATHWTTASWVEEIVKRGGAKESVYFLQDYESWFFPESDRKSRAEVKRTYAMIDNKIVKSNWLQDLIKGDGYPSKKIWLGLDLGIFYPRDVAHRDNVTIIAMARPRTPRRGFGTLISALDLIKTEFPSVSIVLFGDNLASHDIGFEYEGVGVVSSPDKMAELYSTATVFIDASDFQGFGRTALEAMACDTACILTNVGGLSEYARHEENCLLVPPGEPQAICDAFRLLIDDRSLCDRIRMRGMEVAQDFSHKVEAKKTLAYLESIT